MAISTTAKMKLNKNDKLIVILNIKTSISTKLIHINIETKNVFQQKTIVSVKKQSESEQAVREEAKKKESIQLSTPFSKKYDSINYSKSPVFASISATGFKFSGISSFSSSLKKGKTSIIGLSVTDGISKGTIMSLKPSVKYS